VATPALLASPFVFTYDIRVLPSHLDSSALKPYDRVARETATVLSCDAHIWPRPGAEPSHDQGFLALKDVRRDLAGWIVALQLRSALVNGGEFWPTAPATPALNWEYLGCDVADYGLLSAVNFSGLGARAELVKQFSPHLKHNGLFQRDDFALDFLAAAQNARPDDAPFYLIGVWHVIEQHN
jgi:hypothetical protein